MDYIITLVWSDFNYDNIFMVGLTMLWLQCNNWMMSRRKGKLYNIVNCELYFIL
jgi:hypothetical protein